jgi:hypothetical protein
MSREGEARWPTLLEPPNRSPASSSAADCEPPPAGLPSLSAVCRSAATASPPVRADVSQSTASQGRAGGRVRRRGALVGAKRRALTAVLH